MNPCKQEKRALERKLSEMEEEMKVRNNLHCVYSLFLCFVFMSLGVVTQEEDVKGVHGKDLIFLSAVRTCFNGPVLQTMKC